MSTTSDGYRNGPPRRRERGRGTARGSAVAAALALSACLQGPWDYYPENKPVFRGIFATVYVLAGKPVEQACFERVLDIAEERTRAFAWYDSARVTLSGPFSGQSRTIELSPDTARSPNCFRGDSALLAEPGGEYLLEARFVWDSAGTRAVSTLAGTAHIPDSFSVESTASAPVFAVTGEVPENLLDPDFLARLPEEVRNTLLEKYNDTLQVLLQDSTLLREYLEENGPALRAELQGMLGNLEQATYREGDTVTYLMGDFNTLSHYYSARRGAGVGAVLITQRYDSAGGRPETPFDSPLGLEPDSADFYFPGDVRRLLIYPDAVGPGGWNLLDSMGVVNTWFFTGRNRLYFYGFEKAYYDFHATVTQTQGGGGAEGDPRVQPKYNIAGGAGIIAGAIPDSFDVYVETTPQTKVYPLYDTHVLACSEEAGDWTRYENCRAFYPRYCRTEKWEPADCVSDAVRLCLDPDSAAASSLAEVCDSVAAPALKDSAASRAGRWAYCIERDFPAGDVCDPFREECLESRGGNACKAALWDYCLDRNWKPEACGPGLASYCRDKPRLSETLCRHADAWCDGNKESPLCK